MAFGHYFYTSMSAMVGRAMADVYILLRPAIDGHKHSNIQTFKHL
jgi:hypothetical protein